MMKKRKKKPHFAIKDDERLMITSENEDGVEESGNITPLKYLRSSNNEMWQMKSSLKKRLCCRSNY